MNVRKWFDGDYPITQLWANGGNRIAWNYAIGGHPGVDYGCPDGTTVYSIIDGGIVRWAGPAEGFGDHCVAIYYPSLTATVLYGHCGAHFVSVGQTLPANTRVATTDNEGWSTGPHLHVEVRLLDQAFGANPPNVDPVTWLYLAMASHNGADDMNYAIVKITDPTHPGTTAMFREAVKILNPKVDWSNPIQTVEQVRAFFAANGHPEVAGGPPGMLTAQLQSTVYQLALMSHNNVPS